MPEVIQRALICDVPKCGRDGQYYRVNDGRRTVKVILCDEHAQPMLDVTRFGQTDTAAGQSRTARGLAKNRLKGLIKEDDDTET